MTAFSRSIPGFFGGVSQKIPALRHPTQGSVQDNGIATVVDGLFKRPGTRHVATLPVTGSGGLSVASSGGEATGHFIDRGDQGRHVLILKGGNMMVYELTTGTPQVVSLPHGVGYLAAANPATAFRCLTVADTTFIVNREVPVQMTSDVTPANPTNVVYVNVKQTASQNTYFVTVDGAQFNTSTGDTPKNADVANGLAAAINGSLGLTAYRVPNTNCVKITRDSGVPIGSLDVSDTYNNAGLQAISNGVERYSDLPQRFDQNYVVTIKGTEGAGDAYYVKWNGKAYEECAAPGTSYKLDPTTMPHRLIPNGDGTWTFERITEWANRLTGDNDTNPEPSFVGNRINAVFFHRNRLGFLASDGAILSKAGAYFTFWADSAQQVVDTDPIDLAAGADNVTELLWALGFNQTLLVWSNASQQFVLTGGDILSPKNARLQPTTSFAFKPGVRPASIGNKAVFAAPLGDFTQVNLYKVADDRLTNAADDITEDCPKFVPSTVTHLSAGMTSRALVATSHAWTNELYLWKWEQDEQQKLTQRAWQRLALDRWEPVRILCTHWVDRTLYLLICTRALGESAHHFTVERWNFGVPEDDLQANVPLLLDRAVKMVPTSTSGGNTQFDLPFPVSGAVVVLKPREGLEPAEFTPLSVSAISATGTRVVIPGEQAGQFILGQTYGFTYTFTEPYMQDREGTPWAATELKHVRTLVRYQDTGAFIAEVSIPLRQTYTYPFSGRAVGAPNQAASGVALSTGTFSIPVQAKAAGVTVSIKSNSYLPCKFPFGEWVGDVTVKAKR